MQLLTKILFLRSWSMLVLFGILGLLPAVLARINWELNRSIWIPYLSVNTTLVFDMDFEYLTRDLAPMSTFRPLMSQDANNKNVSIESRFLIENTTTGLNATYFAGFHVRINQPINETILLNKLFGPTDQGYQLSITNSPRYYRSATHQMHILWAATTPQAPQETVFDYHTVFFFGQENTRENMTVLKNFFQCPPTLDNEKFLKFDIIPYSQEEMYTLCKRESRNYADTQVVVMKYNVTAVDSTEGVEVGSYIINVTLRNSIGLTAINLEIYSKPEYNLLFYIANKDRMWYKATDNQLNSIVWRGLEIKSVTAIRGRFLMVEGSYTRQLLIKVIVKPISGDPLSFQTSIKHTSNVYILHDLKYKATPAPSASTQAGSFANLDQLKSCLFQKPLEQCAFVVDSSEGYVHNYHTPEEEETFFEFRSKKMKLPQAEYFISQQALGWTTNDMNNIYNLLRDNQTTVLGLFQWAKIDPFVKFDTINKGYIDVYRHEPISGTFDQIIEEWPELMAPNAERHTSKDLIIQSVLKYSNGQASVEFFMSPLKYKSSSRSILNLTVDPYIASVINVNEPFTIPKVLYDDVRKFLYVINFRGFQRLSLDRIRLEIRFDEQRVQNIIGNVPDTTSPNYTAIKFGKDPLPLWLHSKVMMPPQYITFNMSIAGQLRTMYVCHSYEIKTGYYFFEPLHMPSTLLTEIPDNITRRLTHRIEENLPQGMEKAVDFSDMFKGSFLRVKNQFQSNISEIVNDYLGTHIYKIKVRKTKYLESISGFDLVDGGLHRMYFFISTAFENVIVAGDRYQAKNPGADFNYTLMRDFRAMSTMHPTSSGAALVQINDLTYSVLIDQSANTSATDEPSKGTNGVCANNTIIVHYRLGEIFVCIHDGKAYLRPLGRNGYIMPIDMDYKTVQELDRIRELKYMRSSDYYRNYIFVFYEEKVDTNNLNPTNALKGAVFTLENAANPIMVLKHKFDFPQKADMPKILNIQIAGDRIIRLMKPQSATGETILSVLRFTRDLRIESLYNITVPNQLTLAPSNKMVVTDLNEPEDRDYSANTVFNMRYKEYQVAIDMQLSSTRESKILVFNPYAMPLDSMFLIELPAEYQIFDFGPFSSLTKSNKWRTLCVLAAKVQKVDEEYFSKERDLFVFIINDMTPTIRLRAYQNPKIVFTSPATAQAVYINYTFNVTSSIFTDAMVQENKFKTEYDKAIFDDAIKTYSIRYSKWSSSFAPLQKETVTLKVDSKAGDRENKTSLEDFYFRLNPCKYINGTIVNYSGKAESTVEDFMGIIRVLEAEKLTPIQRKPKREGVKLDVTHGKYDIKWHCNQYATDLQTYNLETATERVHACNINLPTNILLSRNNEINKIHITNNVSEVSQYFDTSARNFVVQKDNLFFVYATDRVAYFCNEIYSALNETDRPPPVCSRGNSKPIEGFISTEGLTFEAVEYADNLKYIITFKEFNRNINLYSRIVVYFLQLKTDGSIEYWNKLYQGYVSTSILRLTYAYPDPNGSKDTLEIYSFHHRWREETKLVLVIHRVQVKLVLQGNTPLVTGNLLGKYVLPLAEIQLNNQHLREMIKNVELVAPFPRLINNKFKLTEKEGYFIQLVINFWMGNGYLIMFDLETFRMIPSDITSAGNSAKFDQKLGGIPLTLSQVYIATTENPFIGFMPDSDSPTAVLIDNYFFDLANYQGESYLMKYHFEMNKVRRYTDPTYNNLLGLVSTSNSSESLYKDYLRVSSIYSFTDRPVAFSVIPNYDVSSDLEHRLIYVNSSGGLQNLSLSSYINVRMRTHRVASREIAIKITGTFNQTKELIIKISGNEAAGFWQTIKNMTSILVLMGVSLLISLGIIFFINQDRQMTVFENKVLLMRHSLKPFAGVIGKFMVDRTGQPEENEDNRNLWKEQEEFSSEDSDEAPTKHRISLMPKRRITEAIEPPAQAESIEVDLMNLKRRGSPATK